jgi:hypothetical protein
LDYLLALNPQIKDSNRIYPGDIIQVGVIPNVHRTTNPVATPGGQKTSAVQTPGARTKNTPSTRADDADYFWALAWLEHNSNNLVIPGSIVTGAASNLLSPGNTALIKRISDLYAEYKKGTITKGQYDYKRKVILDNIKKNIGPMEKLLFANKTTHESIRIARGGGVPATAYIDKNFEQLNRVAKLGKHGGIVLTGVGITAACMEIAHTQDRHEKNEIFVETLVSTVAGTGTGVLVGAFLVSNPVGWGTAIVLAAGSVAAGYLSGKVGSFFYDRYGNRIDLVSGMGIDRVCR